MSVPLFLSGEPLPSSNFSPAFLDLNASTWNEDCDRLNWLPSWGLPAQAGAVVLRPTVACS
jgi:hypothetical protein